MFQNKGNYISLNNYELSNKIDIIKSDIIKNKKSKKYQLSYRRKKLIRNMIKYFIFIFFVFIISLLLFKYIF